MGFGHDNRVRFKETLSTEFGYGKRARPSLTAVLNNVRKGFEKGSDKIRTCKKPLSFNSHKKEEKRNSSGTQKKNIINPQGSFLQNWNKIFLFASAIALAIDPLFLYIPIVDAERHCLKLHSSLEIAASVLRTFVDAFYIIHIVFQFRTAYVSPLSRVFGRGELVEDPKAIAIKYLSTYFIIDVLSILPLPQLVVLAVIPNVNKPVSLLTKDYLIAVIFSQYIPRILRIYPLYSEVTRTSGIVTETAWGGAAWNLSLYMLASHVFGALWYLISVEREDRCWREACAKRQGCDFRFLYCEENSNVVNDYLTTSCLFINPDDITNSTVFNFGIFTDALKSGIVESDDFWKKFFYCFWWGLRNLSALGQNLNTSKFVGEIIFAVSICISGLVLFALLIGNMQKYLESTTVREEEMRVRKRDAEQWMAHRMLPEDLRKRIRRYEQYKWQETRGVEEENLLRNLPKDLRRDIKRHFCLDLLKKVPLFEIMDEQLLDAVCDKLRPVLYTENSYATHPSPLTDRRNQRDMELDSITARRRLATVAAHFPSATNDPISAASLVPLNCSSSLNSVIRNCDNKIAFARQASSEQGFFMRQASTDQFTPQPGGAITLKSSVIRRGDSRLYFARQASSAQGLFMRQASTDEEGTIPQEAASTKSFAIPSSTEQPLVSRPEYAPPQFSKAAAKEEFFVLSDLLNQPKENLEKPYNPDLPKLPNPGTVWSPRYNAAEYEHNYVVAVELPGASINDIRVEVDNLNLTVTGRRTAVCQKVDADTKGSICGYHKQEILQGPFNVSWPLPSNVNKDNVSAEFMDGLLRVVIPKL